MSEVVINAEPRTAFGKGAARKLRRGGKVPAVLYGHGTEPKHLTLPGHDLLLALRTPNVLIRLKGDGIDEIALPKGVQRDPIKGFLQHVDLLRVHRGEKVTVELPVTVTGDPIGSAIVEQLLVAVPVEAEATHIPESVEVDVTGKDVGFTVHARDLALPEGVSLAGDPDALVLHVIEAPATAAPAEEQAEE
ncbi:50S ribosomal protein L25 [Thermobispora bispora]|uniref:Large ribosomal subunit protein bL25 n=1 Tax=Thermobispora bispora (strain ATCC 19993 / DSM 43833 / CBS 139.67 / JCM 10125 / KCTC 9307 / NBRC 14880 / R51) TaxID=469371 RepID=D6Y8B1_THEBD|nr:50S ribosomal protein L25/general stress protein Ctc [Thermobispora bispora]MBO2473975.1 50S ribosomal protein L25 [Actinomycetales bacterium]MDI9582575.1 50S ribosomal protein L25/general stress protein Ctc [Thermobispora sp.]ADG89847.1 ribosomal 5S rRNA E-loop binding protein Ctc/L25/TL5 [Thermobispora bispora DSM 43833]MBX6166171.1 50S ribosomal protein L25/general stress protein Ctc [Thermobispora bispora]QSI49427.1 50S ribosomal protein L25/general stress protein Ctc [Thermobispora bis